MKICVVSDSHDNRRLLARAVEDAKQRGAQVVLHCGDVVAPGTLSVLQKYGLPVHVIHGNNTGDPYTLSKMAAAEGSVIRYHGQDAGIELHGSRIFLVHYPHYARAMAATGDWDIVCCGHDHRAYIEYLPTLKGASALLINPGTVGGVGAPPTYVFGDIGSGEFAVIDVPADEPVVQ